MRRTNLGFSLIEGLLVFAILSVLATAFMIAREAHQARVTATGLVQEFETVVAALSQGEQPAWPATELPTQWAVVEDQGVKTVTVAFDLNQKGRARVVCDYASLLVAQRPGMTLNGALPSPVARGFRGVPRSPLCTGDRAVIAMAIQPPSQCDTAPATACPPAPPATAPANGPAGNVYEEGAAAR